MTYYVNDVWPPAGAVAISRSAQGTRLEDFAPMRRIVNAYGGLSMLPNNRVHQVPVPISPRRTSMAIASLRLSASSLLRILPKWKLTVRSEIPSLLPMSGLVRPCDESLRHSTSRGLRGAPCDGGARPRS